MRIDEIVNAPDLLVYHFTDGETLRKIIAEDRIRSGTEHEINGRTISGISLTRDRNLDLLKTYAISGHKPWRIGLNFRKLRNNHKIIPMRDRQYRGIHKAKRVHSHMLSSVFMTDVSTDSNEAEEFLVGQDIYPLSAFWVELAIDSIHMANVNATWADDGDPDFDQRGNTDLYRDIYAGTFGHRHPQALEPVSLPNHVRFVETGGEGWPTHPSQEEEPPGRLF